MAYFSKEFQKFFKELEKNNEKEWFHGNKKRYEKEVKEPFITFLTDLIDAVQEVDGTIPHTAKEGMMRINKDIRFSKDKTPYKTHMAAIISSHGKKDMRLPGMYIQLSNEDVRMYSGCHSMEKDDLMSLRRHIKNNATQFDKLINDKKFKSVFGEVHGQKNKRLPPEFQEAAEMQPLIANKGFYYFKNYSPDLILDDKIISKLVKDYSAGNDLGQFLKTGITSG
ncbi:MAG: DUF2461 domain-containing protein [Cyclobacteriaceae bacterium]